MRREINRYINDFIDMFNEELRSGETTCLDLFVTNQYLKTKGSNEITKADKEKAHKKILDKVVVDKNCDTTKLIDFMWQYTSSNRRVNYNNGFIEKLQKRIDTRLKNFVSRKRVRYIPLGYFLSATQNIIKSEAYKSSQRNEVYTYSNPREAKGYGDSVYLRVSPWCKQGDKKYIIGENII